MESHAKTWLALLLLLFSFQLQAQNDRKVSFNGYLSGMPQVSWTNLSFDSLSSFDRAEQTLLHNRLNFYWYPSEKFTASLQFRNQLMYGDFIQDGHYTSGLKTESYFLPLTYWQTFGNTGLLSLSADRAWLQYTHNNLELTLGRQRINWGQTFVWNPNDIFNAYNFFDFDYAERPGADAVRAIYYPSFTSTIEIAAKLDSAANVTAAGMYRVNAMGTDFQVIGGYYSQSTTAGFTNKKESDIVMGGAVTRDVRGISIRTEGTYMLPTEESDNQNDLVLWSVGLDYSFTNELFLSGEFFYSSRVALDAGGSIFDLFSGPLTVKNLAFAKYSSFLQGSYPITPIFNVTLSGMVFSDDIVTGYFAGPYMDYSLKDNLDLGLYFQFFDFRYKLSNAELRTTTSFAYLRLKWSF